ncbi:MAG: NUDIX domain-containing protein [Tepidimonas sp.]|uniref:NUDIX domain-containing protein n=1 Tax=Tepidimonas sp. TaxID=2002775 RepID=UPI004055240F
MQRRPARGIWAGLWAPPVLGAQAPLRSWLAANPSWDAEWLPAVSHALTHRDLRLQWVRCRWLGELAVQAPTAPGVDATQGAWWPPSGALALGLPAPVRAWLQNLPSDSRTSSSR